MTRGEAIVIIENEKPHCGRSITFTEEEKCEAYEMAIAALKAEPCENAVSAVMHILAELGYGDEENGADAEYMSALYDVAEKVKALPPVTPQKIGHWKRISIDKYSEHAQYWYRCDGCGKDHLGNTAWCPYCGLKMMEGESE